MTHSTELDLSELRDAIRELLSAESDSKAVRRAIAGDAAFRPRLWSKMAELGWFGIATDPKHGGLGLGFSALAVLYEELGRHLTPIAVGQTLLAADALQLAGSDALCAKWLTRLAVGEVSATIALPQINGTAMMTAERRVDGTLEHVLEADTAELLLLPVIDSSGHRALAAVERGSEGLAVLHRHSIDETRALSTVSLRNARLDAEQMLTMRSSDWSALLDHASLAVACDAIGGAGRIFEQTIEYMKTRTQFGRPIGSFQALKARAAHWKIQLEAAVALTGRAVDMFTGSDAGRSRWASDAKFYACDVYAALAGDAIQLHGGIGFTWEHDCHLYLKRAKLDQVLYGSSTQHKERAAELLFARPPQPGAAVKSLNLVETSR